MFWVDLSTAGLIEGQFNTASATTPPTGAISGNSLSNYFPAAKLGNGNYFYVYSSSPEGANPTNSIGISAITNIPTTPCDYCIASSPGLMVSQAAAIDKKIDDGLPQYGNVTATYLDYLSNAYYPAWAAGGGVLGAATNVSGMLYPTTAATPGTLTTATTTAEMAGLSNTL